MANISNLITVLIFITYHFSFIICQFYLETKLKYRSRKSGSGTHLHPKASDLTDIYTSEFLKEIEDRMEGPRSKVHHHRQAAVNTHHKSKRTEDENLPEKKKKAGRKGRKKKEESFEFEDGDPDPSQPHVVAKKKHVKHHHSEKPKVKHENKKAEQNIKIQESCNEKCFTPNCEVECVGEQTSAATRGEDSASLCSGESCLALCYKEECISGCEGEVCFVECHGIKCHAVSEGDKSKSMCIKAGCMAYGNGNRTVIKCYGESCQAQCVGESCVAKCNGTNCVAGCTGDDCHATCVGKNCQRLKHVGLVSGQGGSLYMASFKDIKNDEGYFGNKHYLATTEITTELPNKDKIVDPKEIAHVHSDSDSGSRENVKMEYSIDLRLNPSLATYIRDKILNLQNWLI